MQFIHQKEVREKTTRKPTSSIAILSKSVSNRAVKYSPEANKPRGSHATMAMGPFTHEN